MVAAALPFVSHAAVVEYEATGTFTNSAFPSSVAVGDSFTCRLAYDDSVVDTDPRTDTAMFNGALRIFQFALNPGAAGSYSGGSIVSRGSIEVVNASNVDWFYVFANQGFGSIAGNTVGVAFYLLDYSHSSPINDAGSNQPLAAVLGGTINLNDFRDSYLDLSAGKSHARATISTLTVVPPPGLAVSLLPQDQLRITWPTNAVGYSLQTAGSLTSSSWTTVTNVPALLGNSFAVTVRNTAAQAFYRLSK